MSDNPDTFDAYHRWLGIPPKHQPPNHYRLLALELYENNPEVIRDAAERQSGHVRRYQMGRHMELSQKILNEIAAAKVCLTDPVKKAAYDESLRASFQSTQPVEAPQEPLPAFPWVAPPVISPPFPQPVPPPSISPRLPPTAASTLRSYAKTAEEQPVRSTAKQRHGGKMALIVSTIGAILLLGLACLWLFSERQPVPEAELVLNWPEDQRSGATLTIDNTPVTVKVRGPLEYRCAPGEHRVVVTRPGMHPLDEMVAVQDRTTVIAKWERIPVPTDFVAGATATTRESPSATLTADNDPFTVPSMPSREPPKPPPKTVAQRELDQAVKVATTTSSVVSAPAQPNQPPAPAPESLPVMPSESQKQAAERLKIAMELTNSIGMKLVLIPAGEFQMGSGGRSDEKPVHRVRISKPFYLGVTEVTQGQYEQVMGTNPSNFKGDAQRPVEKVSWNEAVEFCRKLGQKEGKEYRLPTEAQWEYACRAESSTKWSCGDDESSFGEYAWYDTNSDRTTHPVGQKRPNAWGLYDMHGNVLEWCADRYAHYGSDTVSDPTGPSSGWHRVVRGGSWSNSARYCRSADRNDFGPELRFGLGLRVLLTAE